MAAPVTSATLTAMTVTAGSLDSLFGLTDGTTAGTCVEFTRIAGSSPTIEFTLPSVSVVTGLFV